MAEPEAQDPESGAVRDTPSLPAYAAVVLAGGRAARLDGVDKAAVELAGRTLLSRALDACADAAEVVVVGPPRHTERPVRFVVEEPRHGGPVAALVAGRQALRDEPGRIAVVAVDMPYLTPVTLRRLLRASAGRDGAVLTDPGGRRQLALALDVARLDAVTPAPGDRDGHPVHRLLRSLDLVEVPAVEAEHRDVDTWEDLRDLGGRSREDDVP